MASYPFSKLFGVFEDASLLAVLCDTVPLLMDQSVTFAWKRVQIKCITSIMTIFGLVGGSQSHPMLGAPLEMMKDLHPVSLSHFHKHPPTFLSTKSAGIIMCLSIMDGEVFILTHFM